MKSTIRSTAMIVFVFCNCVVKSQSNDECKYLSVLTYFYTNPTINEKIKAFFPMLFKKNEKAIEFNLSDRIDFLSISLFGKKIKEKNFGISVDLIDSPKLFYNKYYFESYKIDFLKKVLPVHDSRLFLTFSKPIDNILVVELGSFDPAINSKMKFGRAMQVLFKFDSFGLVEDALYAGSVYN